MSKKQKKWEVREIFIKPSVYLLPSRLLEFAQEIGKKFYDNFSYIDNQKQIIVFALDYRSGVGNFCTTLLNNQFSLPFTFSCSSVSMIYWSILRPYSFTIGELVYCEGRLARVLSSPGNNSYTVSHPAEDSEAVYQDQLQKINYKLTVATPDKVVVSETSIHPKYLIKRYSYLYSITITRLPPEE